jgi:hypothetical protein
MNRRRLLKVGGGTVAASAVAGGALAYRFVPSSPGDQLGPPSELAGKLLESVSPELRARLQVDYDHPYRQYHNRGVWGGGVNVARADLTRAQRNLVVELMHSGLSSAGRTIIPNQMLLKIPDAVFNNLLICGEPDSAECQILFTGPHLNLRIGGANREGVAFGGPQVYGDQRGNKAPGLPGNVYRPQLAAGMALYGALSPEQQKAAVIPQSPIQTRIEVQGSNGAFAGVPVAEMTPDQKQTVRRMIDLTFAPYPEADVAYARACLEANGGLGALHASFYADSAYEGSQSYQTYRLEGPAAVFYFRGFPHVHAFFNVAMDGEAPLSVGEVVTRNSSVREGPSLKVIFEAAMRAGTDADFGFYDLGSAVGALRPGAVRTGDVYTAESWENFVSVVAVRGADVRGEFAADLAARGVSLDAERTYRIATADFVANELLEEYIGSGRILSEHGYLRDMTIDHLRDAGLG